MKKNIADAIYKRHGGITRKEAHELLHTVLEVAKEALREEDSIKIPNFGVFRVRPIERKEVTNPRTGEHITITRKNTIVFKPAKYFLKVTNE